MFQNKRTLIIDNYDSFTFNLFQYFKEFKGNPLVYKNDTLTLDRIIKINPTHIVISPGPGTVKNSSDFGICLEVIRKLGPTTPLLGICLGHQGITYAFGGDIIQTSTIFHGKTSVIEHDGSKIFQNIPSPLKVMRYHSLCIDPKTIPKNIKITAWTKKNTEKNIIMGIEHLTYPIFGVQFHPESFRTEYGKEIIKNFLNIKTN